MPGWISMESALIEPMMQNNFSLRLKSIDPPIAEFLLPYNNQFYY